DPLYRQIAEDLRQQIESGELPPGSQLRTELELREHYDASRNTVRDAVKLLITRGLVATRPGQGTFVVEKIEPFAIALDIKTGFGEGEGTAYATEVIAGGRTPTVSAPRIEIQSASTAPELLLDKAAMVVSRHQQRFIDGIPWSLQTSFYPMSLVEQGASQIIVAQDMPDGVVRYLEDDLGLKQVGWRDRITVRAPDQVETAFFRLPEDGRVPVFEVRRTAFQESGTPLRVTVTTYPTDRNGFFLTSGEVPDDARLPDSANDQETLALSSNESPPQG
ncbi:MAG: GntR family transcriptional regulator, partial [Streptosporangiaceae bacterium]